MAVGDRLLQGADAPPQYYTKPQGFSINIETQDPAEAERLAQGGQHLIRGGRLVFFLQHGPHGLRMLEAEGTPG